MKERRTGRLVAVLAIVGIAVIVIVSSVSGAPTLFDLNSSAPGGYKALRLLAEEHELEFRSVSAASPSLAAAQSGSTIFVPAPDLMNPGQLESLVAAADRGATLIYGSPPPLRDQSSEDEFMGGSGLFSAVSNEALAEAPANLVAPGTCDIPELVGLGRIDSLMSDPVQRPIAESRGLPAEPTIVRSCYGQRDRAEFVEVGSDGGRIFVLGSPFLWVNARLQPNKEEGGKVLDNAVTALRLLSAGSISGSGEFPDTPDEAPSAPNEVLFIKAVPSADSIASGTRDPLELLPDSFKALLVALGVAVVFYIWSNATRLGQPVDESAEVKINSSELTAAIGRLFEDDPRFLREGAEALRREARASFSVDVGVPVAAGPEELCRAVARRSGREASEVMAVLFGDEAVLSSDELLGLERRIEQLRTEVGHVATK